MDPDGEVPAADMEQAVTTWVLAQRTSGVTVNGDAEDILRELKHQPDIKYVRVRRDGENTQGTGQGRAWVYVGVKVRSVQVSTS